MEAADSSPVDADSVMDAAAAPSARLPARADRRWRRRPHEVAPYGLLALVGCVIALAAWVPWNSAIWPPPDIGKTTQIEAFTINATLWLSAAATALRLHIGRRLWLILAAVPLVSSVTWTLQFIPNNWAWWTGWTFMGLGTAVFAHALVAFPTGALTRRGDRALVTFVYGFTVVTSLIDKFTVDYVYDKPFWNPNPFLIVRNDTISTVNGYIGAAAIPLIGLAVIVAVSRHWREAGPVGRRALAPALVALPFAYVTNVAAYVGDNLGIRAMSDFGRQPLLLALNMIVPVGLLVGMLRARLRRGGVADFVLELGQGVPLGSLRDRIARAVGDPTLQLAFRSPGGEGFVDGAGQSFELPGTDSSRSIARLDRDGETLAVIVHDPAIDEESPGLVGAVAGAARLALDNERLAAEVRAQLEAVRASRARIAEAADEERRKVERDLHDGAQQRLVALTMRLEQARASAAGSAGLIDEATAELRTAIAEVRQLARGMHPPILTEAGLAAAVESLAERLPLPVKVRLPSDRFAAPIEGAAYFVVSEALTNVSRYSGASTAIVEGEIEASEDERGGARRHLVVRVLDDGSGGADPTRGTGLRGLADRVAAVGGTLAVDSPPGGGTTVTAVFGLTPDA